MTAFIKGGMGDPGVEFGWKHGETVHVGGEEASVFYVLDGVYPARLGPGRGEGKAIYLLGGHETFCIQTDKPEPLVHEICEVVVKGLGSGQPRATLTALVHLADCALCMGGIAAISQALPNSLPGKPPVADLFKALRDRLKEDDGERLSARIQKLPKT